MRDEERGTAPAAGKAEVRALHFAPEVPAVDVAVKGGAVIFSSVGFPSATSYSPVEAGSYDLELRAAGTDQVLHVRQHIPARRHTLIFETYADLAPGDGFVLVNDHDPKPLYYQFAAEHANQFEWDYLEEGPEVWRVRIGRPAA